MFDSHRRFKFGSDEYITAIGKDIANYQAFKGRIIFLLAVGLMIFAICSK